MPKMTKKKETSGIRVYPLKEGYEIVKNNVKDDVKDTFAKYPQTMLVLSRLVGNEAFEQLLEGIPSYVSLRKIEDRFKNAGSVNDEEELEEELEEDEEELEEDEEEADAGSVKVADGEEAGEELEEDEEDENNPPIDYTSMRAMELYKLCRERGINTTPKQRAAVYIKLLEKADAKEIKENKQAHAAEEEWEEEEKANSAPKKTLKPKTTSKAPAKKNKSAATKAAEEAEEWDF